MAIIKADNLEKSNQTFTMIVYGAPGLGKALANGTPVLSEGGTFKPIESLTVGDKVFGEDGKLHSVIGVFPQGKRPTYNMYFNDNTMIQCDEDHIWTVLSNKGRKYNLTTKQLLQKGLYYTSDLRERTGRKPQTRWRIPICEPIDLPEKEFVIHPYVLGVLLGNGALTSGKSVFTNSGDDTFIADKISQILPGGYTLTEDKSDTANSVRYYIKSPNNNNLINQEIKRLGIDVTSADKNIPEEYMNASISQRTELLRGLMDTDGNAKDNRINFCTTSQNMANSVAELVRSLGGMAKIHIYDREKENKSTEYRVTIRLNVCPFSLPRKEARWKPSVFSKRICEILPAGETDCTCIKVDNPSELFVTSHYIVTHNTTLALSAPDAIVIDFDNGIHRVAAQHRRDYIHVTNYEEVLRDIESPEFKACKTVVIDTGGSFVTFLKDWAMRTKPGARLKSGDFNSLKGFGFVKSEFADFTARIKDTMHKNLIYVFHSEEKADKDGNPQQRLMCEGAAKNTVWNTCDFGGYMQMIDGKRMICFSPDQEYFAKGCHGISGMYEVPNLSDGTPNNFVANLFQSARNNIDEENEYCVAQRKKYSEIMEQVNSIISGVTNIETANEAVKSIGNLEHVMTSKIEAGAALKAKTDELNIKWSKTANGYISAGE